jgi:F-type H+-transporting ATPase subunit gamma
LKKESLDHPITELSEVITEKDLVIPITSDKGLCGGLNSSIIRPLKKVLAVKPVKLLCVGDRSKSALNKAFGKQIVVCYGGNSKIIPCPFLIASVASESIASVEGVESVAYIWNSFKNAVAFHSKVSKFPTYNDAVKDLSGITGYEVEGHETLRNLYEFSQSVFLHRFLIENGVCEQSQRMAAMENSTKSAMELIGTLQILYNRTRQARITTELVEIVSGAAAVDDTG